LKHKVICVTVTEETVVKTQTCIYIDSHSNSQYISQIIINNIIKSHNIGIQMDPESIIVLMIIDGIYLLQDTLLLKKQTGFL